MLITFSNTLRNLPAAVIIPLAASESLEPALNKIAQATGQPAALLRQDFKADQGEVHTLYMQQQRYFLLGLGAHPSFAEVLRAFRSFSHKHRQKMACSIGVSLLHDNLSGDASLWAEAATNGLLLGAYAIGRFKNQPPHQVHPLAQADARVDIIADENLEAQCLAAADKEPRLGTVASPGNGADRFDTGRFGQLREFVEVFLLDRRAQSDAHQYGPFAAAGSFEHPPLPQHHQSAATSADPASSAAGTRTLRAGTTVEMACL